MFSNFFILVSVVVRSRWTLRVVVVVRQLPRGGGAAGFVSAIAFDPNQHHAHLLWSRPGAIIAPNECSELDRNVIPF